jgi:hypothetical protein
MRRFVAFLVLAVLAAVGLSGCGGEAADVAVELASKAEARAGNAADAASRLDLPTAQSLSSQAGDLARQAQEAAVEGSPSEKEAAGTATADTAAVDVQVGALEASNSLASDDTKAVLDTVKDAACTIASNYSIGQPPPPAEEWTARIRMDLQNRLGSSLPAYVLDALIAKVEDEANAWIDKVNSLYQFDATDMQSFVDAFTAFEC